MTSGLLEKVRAIALEQPGATERLSHGSLSWFVETAPMFASFDDHHHGADHVAIWAAAPDGVQSALVQQDDELWFVPPYVGARGWIGMRLSDDTDWSIVEDVLAEAWETVAKPAQRARLVL